MIPTNRTRFLVKFPDRFQPDHRRQGTGGRTKIWRSILKGETMKEYTVNYYLSEEQETMLKEVTELFNVCTDKPISPERYFSLLMKVGSANIINRNIELAKIQLEAQHE